MDSTGVEIKGSNKHNMYSAMVSSVQLECAEGGRSENEC